MSVLPVIFSNMLSRDLLPLLCFYFFLLFPLKVSVFLLSLCSTLSNRGLSTSSSSSLNQPFTSTGLSEASFAPHMLIGDQDGVTNFLETP